MKERWGILIGESEHFPFEERIFHFAMLLGIVMTAFGTIMDVHYHVDIRIDLVFIGCWVLTYYLSRFRGYFKAVSVVSTGIFVFVFIPYVWISSGGVYGIIPSYTILFVATISIILSGVLRAVMVGSMLAVELFLIGSDAYRTGTFNILVNKELNLIDFSIHTFVIMGAMAGLVMVYSNTYMKEKARSEGYSKAIAEQYQQQLYYMENLEQLIFRLKSERHDFNHHLGVIYGLLAGGDVEKAGEYVARQVTTAEEYRNLVNIPYPMIRAMMNYKLSVAMENRIDLRLDVNLPEELELAESDLTVVLGNLLDNAVEACMTFDEDARWLNLKLSYKPDYLILQIENPVQGEPVQLDGAPFTTKADSDKHGFGLKNIDYLVSKHNGIMKVNSKPGVFKVEIAILVGIAI